MTQWYVERPEVLMREEAAARKHLADVVFPRVGPDGTFKVVHENEIAVAFKALNGKASKEANDEAHARLWLFLRISLFAIAAASLGALVLKALGT